MSGPAQETRRTDVNRVIAGYRLEAPIGRGGMGVVYRATGPDGCPAAVKLLLQASFQGSELLSRFEREARVRIEHPNICRIRDAGAAEDGTPYIVFELLQGEGLDKRLERGPLAPAEAVEVGVQVCRGLAAAHAAGVVHRDLKPSNLFLCTDGTVKLFDFGIAQLRSAMQETKLTATGMVMGTPSYLSPEQARGDGRIDARTDIWSLGALLYEALCGQRPFDRDSVLATIYAVLMEPPMSLAARVPGLPRGLVAVVEQALCKAPAERWTSADALGRALQQADLVAGEPEPMTLLHGASIVPGEQRLVAVLLAEDVTDHGVVECAVRQRGGVYLPLVGRRGLGLFGGAIWEGDELPRAASAALSARPAAARVAVASGRASHGGEGIAGGVLRAAEEGCALKLPGIAVSGETVRGLTGGFSLRSAAEGFWEISADSPPCWPMPEPETGAKQLLGRQAELLQMQLALEGVLDDRRATAVLVTGPPGIGKSRLRQEMERLLEEVVPPVWALVGRAESLARDTAFALLVSALQGRARLGAMLRGWPRLGAEAPPEERRQALLALAREALGDDAAPAPTWLEPLGELLGIPSSTADATAATAPHDPQLIADRLRLAVLDYFEALCAQGPTALLLEDLQWADEASAGVIELLMDRLAERPFLLFLTARSELAEARPDLLEGRNVIRLQPRGLGSAEAARLAQSIAGRALPASLVHAIAERSAGNPLFVREIVLELRERGLPEGEVGFLPLPLSVEAAVQSRLDHLLPPEKELCKRASVFGRPFTADAVTAVGVFDVPPLLGSLTRREILAARTRTAAGGEREYQFRSTLFADVAYSMLTDELRQELHGRAAEFLARSAQPDPDQVVHHYERAGKPEQAARWYAAAALGAAGRGDSASVARNAERALRLGGLDVAGFELHLANAIALGYLGRRDDQHKALIAAMGAAGTERERAAVLPLEAEVLWRTGRLEDALASAAAGAEAARRAGDRNALALIRGWQVAVLVSAGRLPEASSALGEALQVAPEASPATRAFVESRAAGVYQTAGDLSGARDAFQRAAGLYRQAGDVRRAVGAEANLADTYNRVGAYADAEVALRAAREGCRKLGLRVREGFALCNLGYALTRQGRNTEAHAALQEAATIARTAHDTRLMVPVEVYAARAETIAGRHSEAASRAEAAARDAERTGDRSFAALGLTVAAQASLAAGDTGKALALSERALALRDQLGGTEEDEAEIFLTRARVLSACGRAADAETVTRRGRERLQAVGERIGDPAWRERFLRDVVAARALLEESS